MTMKNMKSLLALSIFVVAAFVIQGSVSAQQANNPKFNKMMPKSRRNNQYARNFTSAEMRTLRERLECTSNRYKVVNIQSFWRHGTIEFRQHSGTIETQKIINWIKITQRVMIRAKELVTNDIWTYSFRRFENELHFCPEIKSYIEARYIKFASPEEVNQAA